jgi:hypothetical protein
VGSQRPQYHRTNAASKSCKEALFDMEFAWREWQLESQTLDGQPHLVDISSCAPRSKPHAAP